MEFLRFGSSIPGSYWGCCAACIIQDFKQDPDEPASIQIVSGDGGQPIGDNFAGLTYREIFETRLRIGTFNTTEMPNHAFLAILTQEQLETSTGMRWLEILRNNGFEFVRSVSNSVYADDQYLEDGDEEESYENYIFGLFRNVGTGAIKGPLTPPNEWTQLSGGVKQPVDFLTENQKEMVNKSQNKFNSSNWEKTVTKFYTEDEVRAAGVTVTYAGVRSKFPQQTEKARDQAKKDEKQANKSPAPFVATSLVPVSP